MNNRLFSKLLAVVGIFTVALLSQATARAAAAPVSDCAGCMYGLTLTPPSGDTGPITVCSNGATARLVLTVAPRDGACIRNGTLCLAGDCSFSTSLSYASRGAVELKKSTGAGSTSLGIFPSTSGVLTTVSGQQNVVTNVPCGLGVMLKYAAISQACANPTIVTVEADMSCTACVHN